MSLVVGLSPDACVRRPTAPARGVAGSEAYYEFLLGRHLEGEGDVDEAIAAYERARALDPHVGRAAG